MAFQIVMPLPKKMEEERADWVVFTAIWARECRRRREPIAFAQLAKAMSAAESHRQSWGDYIALALAQVQRFHDEEHGGLMRQKMEYQIRGWEFFHDCRGWRAEKGGSRTGLFWLLRDLLGDLCGSEARVR